MTCEDIAPLISAFVDGELSSDAASRVAAHLDACGGCRAVKDDYEVLAQDLRRRAPRPASPALRARVLAGLAAEPREGAGAALPRQDAAATSLRGEPARAKDARQVPLKSTLLSAAHWRRVAAACALCIASSAATYVATTRLDRARDLRDELTAAHVRSLLQDNPMQVASSDSHTVRPWFAGRVEFAPNVKDLSAQGYPLQGARLDLVAGRRTAVAVYKRDKHWINIYMWPSAAAESLPGGLFTRAGYNLLTWTRDGVLYCAVSDLNMTDLRELARLLS